MSAAEPTLLSPVERPAVRILNRHGRGRAVLVCEHASPFIPASLDNLLLDDESTLSHAAWDIGAGDLAIELMGALDAPLVASRVSRLVYDCNRPPEAPDAIPALSEVHAVPGNANLTGDQRAARIREIYLPFQSALADLLDSRPEPPVVITVHSFTPVYNGQRRTVELGILHDSDERTAMALLAATHGCGLITALNQPYSAADGVTHTLREHAIPRGLPNVMLEIRNDLIDTAAGVNRIAGLLAPMLQAVVDDFAPAGSDA